MARTKLTAGRVTSLTLPEGAKQDFLWDADVTQLAVRVTVGAKSYVFQSRIDGRSLRLTIGKTTDWSIDAARKEARRLQMLVDQGVDPREQKAAQRESNAAKRIEAARKTVTVADAWQAYIDARSHKWSVRHQTDHEDMADAGGRPVKRGEGRTSPGVLAPLMPLKLSQIDSSSVKDWLGKEAGTALLAQNWLLASFVHL